MEKQLITIILFRLLLCVLAIKIYHSNERHIYETLYNQEL